MAETPFSPESGAASGGTAPEDGNQGSPAQPSAEVTADAAAELPAEVSAPPSPAEGIAEALAPDVAAGVSPEAVTSDSTPEPTPSPSEPVVAAAPEPAAQPPGVAATIAVPPLEEPESGGGEWELLVERLGAWWNSGELNRQWQRIRGPLKGVAIVVLVLLALQVYATVVSTIDAIPLVSGLLELTGLIAVLQFSSSRLLRSSDRQEVLAQLQRRWQDFRGRS